MNRHSLNRTFFALAFFLGLLSVLWVGAGFVQSSPLALAMTLLIGGVFLIGAQELRRYRQATHGLARAVAEVSEPPTALADWLQKLPAPLRPAVRQRVESERGALPGLALTPYLIGLLVMLGMLGTFLGMVVTFQGVVFTLEGSADLQAIRSALAAPIKGLGLAFGTSVVGVATSAMLGLMAAIARRERGEAVRQLDACVATVLRPFSLAQQRQASFDAMQQQTAALPAVVTQLQALVEQIERRSQQVDEQLLERQARFLESSSAAHLNLARSVERSLQDSLQAGARASVEGIVPVVQNAVTTLTQDTARALTGFVQGWEARSTALIDGVQDRLSAAQARQAEHERERQAAWTQALQHTATGLQNEWKTLGAQTLAQQETAAQTLAQAATRWRDELATLRGEETARGDAALQRLTTAQEALNTQVAVHLERLGTALEEPLARVAATANEAPRAAAELMAQWRQETTRLGERDQQSLQERATLMAQIDSLLQSVQQTTGEQRAAIESLVASAGAVLDQVGRQFAETVGAQAVRADEVAARVGASAAEIASLGEAFDRGVQRFSSTNEQLLHSLKGVEDAVLQSIARSDEQLAYYVAQAREVIDLSISSQQGILDDLRRLRSAPAVSVSA